MRIRRVMAVMMGAVLLGACSTAASNSAAPGGSVAPGASAASGNGIAATMVEWSITLTPSTGTSGETTFTIANNGGFTHEFVVRKTDLAADSLPLNAAGEVDEDDPQLEDVGEVEEIEAGGTGTLTVSLAPGHYVVFCNLHVEDVLHYKEGLHTDLTVS